MSIELKPDETNLRDKIVQYLDQSKKLITQHSASKAIHEVILQAGTCAHELHMSLKDRGLEPRHHKYMVKNRELAVDHPDFYKHIHPIEDLLKFLNDEHANDDPEDQTIGCKFTFRVFSRRWGHDDTYDIVRTKTGWDVSYTSIGGTCDKGGQPFLFRNFQQDFIEFPNGLDGWLEWLWNQAESKGLSVTEVQDALQKLADWVSLVEKNAPSDGVWKGY